MAAVSLGARGDRSSTMRTSSVAVRPMMSLARATSCTPGSCTTMRSAPCCWIIGSATPSSLTRLRSVVMFCWTPSSMRAACSASGLQRADQLQVGAVGGFGRAPGRASARPDALRALARVAASRKRIFDARRRRGRCRRGARSCRAAWLRTLVCRPWTRLFSTALVSTCSRKCTPPRRSRPRYIGSAPRLCSQRGVFGSRLKATTSRVGRVAVQVLFQRPLGLELGVGVGEAARDRAVVSPSLRRRCPRPVCRPS